MIAHQDSPRPWLRPPRIRTPADADDEERHASWLELFFDLVFVVAIAELARQLTLDHSLGGFGIFAGLFLPVFIAWQGFTFYADRFDTDDVLFRGVMLAAMLAIAALAAQIPDVAAGRHDSGFVIAYATLRSLLIALYLLCLTVCQQVSAHRLPVAARRARALAGITLVALAGRLTPLSLAAGSAAALAALVVFETRLVRDP